LTRAEGSELYGWGNSISRTPKLLAQNVSAVAAYAYAALLAFQETGDVFVSYATHPILAPPGTNSSGNSTVDASNSTTVDVVDATNNTASGATGDGSNGTVVAPCDVSLSSGDNSTSCGGNNTTAVPVVNPTVVPTNATAVRNSSVLKGKRGS
jgi:hypothetical protein